jgi:molybdopterin-binding protein
MFFYQNSKSFEPMKLSARNKIKGTIKEVKIGSVMAKVAVEIADGTIINSMITIDSVEDMNLKAGDEVYAIIKSTEVMIGK